MGQQRRGTTALVVLGCLVGGLSACSSGPSADVAHKGQSEAVERSPGGASSTPADPTDFSAFSGRWASHNSGVRVSPSGRAEETISVGCCDVLVQGSYQLSNPHKEGPDWVADARLTQVLVNEWDRSQGPPPRAGQRLSVQVRDGRISSVFEPGQQFCNVQHYDSEACGA